LDLGQGGACVAALKFAATRALGAIAPAAAGMELFMSEPGRAPSVSRRSFLGRAGVAASGVALLGEVGLATATEEPTIAGLGVVAIALTVNGRACEVSVQPRAAVVLGAAAPVPWRARQAEAALVG